MAWYRETDYPQIPAYNRSFIIALANLIQHLNAGNYPPDVLTNLLTSDDPYLDWLVLPEYVKTVSLGEVHDDDPQWPVQNGAIVKFKRIDFESGNQLDHYCLVIDARQMAIVDSFDGIIKHGTSYGQIYAWATYTLAPEEQRDALVVAVEEKRAYVIGPDENIWDAARKINQKVATLMDYNGIGDPRKVKEGYVINIPPSEYVEKRNVEYRMFDEALIMKVIKAGGTTKYAFGNATKWLDVHAVGRLYPEGHIMKIAGEARVFLDNEEEDTEAAYYMERIDMGRFRDTGLVQFSIGLNHSHLAIASETVETVNDAVEIIAPPVEPPEEPQPIIAVAEVVEEEVVEPPALELPVFKPEVDLIREDGRAEKYVVLEDIYVHELQNKRAPKLLKQNQVISLTYQKEIRDLLYYIPGIPFDDHGLTFLIPRNKIVEEDVLHDTSMSVSEKIAMGTPLSYSEGVFAVISYISTRSIKLKTYLKKKH